MFPEQLTIWKDVHDLLISAVWLHMCWVIVTTLIIPARGE